MAVISIIALLVGILLPALRSARTAGQAARSLSIVRPLTLALNMYANDAKSSLPFGSLNGAARFVAPVDPRAGHDWAAVLRDMNYATGVGLYDGPARN